MTANLDDALLSLNLVAVVVCAIFELLAEMKILSLDQVEVRRWLRGHSRAVRSSSSARFANQRCALTDLHQRGAQPCATCARTSFSLFAASLSNSVAGAMLAVNSPRHAVLKLRDPCLHDVDTRLCVAQLFLVILYRMSVASDLMRQHLRLILALAEALYAVTALPLHHLAKRGTTAMRRTTKNSLHLPKLCIVKHTCAKWRTDARDEGERVTRVCVDTNVQSQPSHTNCPKPYRNARTLATHFTHQPPQSTTVVTLTTCGCSLPKAEVPKDLPLFLPSLPVGLAICTKKARAASVLGPCDIEDLSDIDDEDVFCVPNVTQPEYRQRTV